MSRKALRTDRGVRAGEPFALAFLFYRAFLFGLVFECRVTVGVIYFGHYIILKSNTQNSSSHDSGAALC